MRFVVVVVVVRIADGVLLYGQNLEVVEPLGGARQHQDVLLGALEQLDQLDLKTLRREAVFDYVRVPW